MLNHCAAVSSAASAPTHAANTKDHRKTALFFWSIFPMVLWYAAANGVAYYFTSHQHWVETGPEVVALYALVTLYVVPFVLTLVTGLVAWGYALRAYGPWGGCWRSLGVFAWQWLAVLAMTKASINWHYVYFYSEKFYS